MKTIAVTGASGFVGQHVLNAIAIAGHRSIALSRRPVQADRSEWIHLDLSNPDPSTIRAIAAADSVIHLAWGGLPNYRSASHLEIELPRQIAFVEHLVKGGVRSLIVSGTCLEYGNQEGECSEKVNPTPVIPYAQAKDRLRRHLEQMRERTPFALCWCRLFYMYGHGQPAHSLWQQLHNKAIAGERWFPMSGGQQIRDFLPVEEVARRLALMAITNANADVVNICSGIPTTVEQIVRTWIRKHSWSIEPDLGRFPYLDYEPLAFWGSADHWHQVELNAQIVLSGHDES
jgi:dTDP-6-deoxy-L-talose 4-dehydrogenase (NAD+)